MKSHSIKVFETLRLIQDLDMDLDFDDELELAALTREFIDGYKHPKVYDLSITRSVKKHYPIEEMPVDFYMDRQLGWREI